MAHVNFNGAPNFGNFGLKEGRLNQGHTWAHASHYRMG